MGASSEVRCSQAGPSRVAALALLAAAAARAAPAEFCVDDARGWVTATSPAPCPSGTHILRAAGANTFDIVWSAWGADGSLAGGNLSAAFKTVRDAGASGIAVARAFAAPWSYAPSWAWLDPSRRTAYWAAAGAVVDEAARVGLQLVLSIGHGCADATQACNPARLCPGEAFRDLVVNSSSCTRSTLRAYAQDLVAQFRNNSAVLFFEAGNELNLAFDGCAFDKSDGAFFSQSEGLAFLADFAADIKAADAPGAARPVSTGMSAPRLRARHLAGTQGGGRACVSAANPKGDCDLACPGVGYDSLEDSVAVLHDYYGSGHFDMVSAHWYSCDAPGGNYSWCPETVLGNATTFPIAVFKAVADNVSLPLYVGEYGPDAALAGGWGLQPWQGPDFIASMALHGVPLSTLWAFECPSHDDMGGLCLHPGRVDAGAATARALAVVDDANRALNGVLPAGQELLLFMLPPPAPGANLDPACLDGTAYGYYAQLGARRDKWIVTLEGGGWCIDAWTCYTRTQPSVQGGALGSSKSWPLLSNAAQTFGPLFDEWSYLCAYPTTICLSDPCAAHNPRSTPAPQISRIATAQATAQTSRRPSARATAPRATPRSTTGASQTSRPASAPRPRASASSATSAS